MERREAKFFTFDLDKSEKESYYELLNSEISFSRHFL
jgi:hypothetical protein